MASYIDWYIVELERRLTARMPAERVFTAVTEAEEHLHLKAADLECAGMSASASEKAAVESFGTPHRVAFGLLEGLVGRASSVVGTVFIVAATLLVLLTATAMCTLGSWSSLSAWCSFGFLAAGFLVMVGTVLARKAQPRAIFALAVPIALLSGYAMSKNLILGGQPVPRDTVQAIKRMDAVQVNDLHRELVALADGLHRYQGLNAAEAAKMKKSGGAPLVQFGQFVVLPSVSNWNFGPKQIGLLRAEDDLSYAGFGIETTTDMRMARDSWIRNAPALISEASYLLKSDEATIAEADTVLSNQPRLSPPLFGYGAGVTILLAVGVWIMNLGAVQLARLLRWMNIARPRMAG